MPWQLLKRCSLLGDGVPPRASFHEVMEQSVQQPPAEGMLGLIFLFASNLKSCRFQP